MMRRGSGGPEEEEGSVHSWLWPRSGCLTPRPLPSPLARVQVRMNTLPPLHPTFLQLQGMDIKSYLQHPTHPNPSRLGPRHRSCSPTVQGTPQCYCNTPWRGELEA